MRSRPINLSAGPGALPASVLEAAAEAIRGLPDSGVSILGLSHRSRLFRAMLDEAEERLRRLIALPSQHSVLFMQGGGTLQFSMVPMAMLGQGRSADYIVSGYWSQKAARAAAHHGAVRVVWDGRPFGFDRLPARADPLGEGNAAYMHYVSNETVEGLRFDWLPSTRAPLVCDMSSDFLSRPLDASPYSLIYAHAQKNFGPAGVTVVLVREDVLAQVPEGLPEIFDYRAHAAARSLLHTPPVFSIYVVLLFLRWLEDEVGGLHNMQRINRTKAERVRSALAATGNFYRRAIRPGFESDMNITFACSSPELDSRFIQEALRAGLIGVEGHRSRGGLRISLYDGVTIEEAEAVAAFLVDFADAQRTKLAMPAADTLR